MNKPLQVGITGGIGSGKSLICKIFASLGVPVYDADSRAKKLMTTDGILVEEIKKEFGNLSFNADGGLNKEHLRKAFEQPTQLEKLNKLVHPRVGLDYSRWLGQQMNSKYVIKEAALMIESGSSKSLDILIVVKAPVSLRIERVLARDPHRTKQDILNIISNQMNEEDMIGQADYVIANDGTQLLIPQVLELHERFTSQN